jgi:hypothetical protein
MAASFTLVTLRAWKSKLYLHRKLRVFIKLHGVRTAKTTLFIWISLLHLRIG